MRIWQREIADDGVAIVVQRFEIVPAIVPVTRQNRVSRANKSQVVGLAMFSEVKDFQGNAAMVERRLSV
jgi:hypothetical protein